MSAPKRFSTKSPAAALAGFALGRARVALQDPKTKAMLMQQAAVIARHARTWSDDRQVIDSTGHATADAPDRAAAARPTGGGRGQFGQRGLQRRVEHLRQSIATLGEGRPELAEALDPVATSVEQVAATLGVVGGLPLLKRKRAHRRIGQAIDELEDGLLTAALPQESPGQRVARPGQEPS